MIITSKKFLSVALVAVFGFGAQAQSLADKFNNFTQQATQEYDDFRMKANQAYAEFMRKAWEEMDLEPPEERIQDESVEPEIWIDGTDEIATNDFAKVMPLDDFVIKPKPQPVPVSPVLPFTWPEQEVVNIDFYGTDLKIRFDDRQKFTFQKLDNDLLADTWLKCSSREYNNTLSDCLSLREKLSLNDWAYLRLLYKFAQEAMKSDNEAVFLTAYLYAQSGYKMRLYRKSDSELSMLYATQEKIYGEPYMILDGERMYALKEGFGGVYVCNIPFEKEEPLSLGMVTEPVFNHNYAPVRELRSRRFPEVKAQVSVDHNLIDFYNDYPQFSIGDDPLSRWVFYANMPLDSKVQEQLYPVLREAIKDCTQRQAVHKLLNFVQTAFVYGHDTELWGCDRAFFSEETLFYPYSDCEDRAILYTRLVRDLIGIPTALIYYPRHLGAAVAFDEEELGDYVIVNDRRYTITDPTYINADVGRSMKKHPVNTARPIVLKD